ncbi:DUF1853 family protein [Arenibacter certesii]|uniref:DUF1853 family protein n=1 Tax=Arenibacter certesii TaxID=228955 RepID=A0A918IQJ4_9FLAO|nr:DUF1853 family protein [Arenibacter certesii]GGW25668.1 hypothetical protein GCM10007383_08010 [Arenibacter certesii]
MNNQNLSLYQAFKSTPPLWYNSYEGLEQFIFTPNPVQEFEPPLIPEKLRLGHQLEFIFHQLLLHSNTYKVLGNSIPIRKNKITQGEMDFILQNIDNKQFIHLELTYKFYIVTGDKTTQLDEQLIGPNHRDTFLQKKDKLINHQLTLSGSKEGKETLIEHGIDPTGLTPQVCFKSQLFTPYFHREIDLTPFNQQCISGTWISCADFISEEFKLYQYYIPSKLEWILPPHNNVEWRSYFTILEDITIRIKNKNAPLLWLKKSETIIEKMFVLWRNPTS